MDVNHGGFFQKRGFRLRKTALPIRTSTQVYWIGIR